VLTHLYPVCDASEIEAQSRKVFAGRVTVAHDGLVLDV
jgi:ribonuclease BN (tRNA processing enzyme)